MPLLSSNVSEDAGIEHKSWKGPNWILRGLEENNSWNNPEFEISCQATFKLEFIH